MNISSQESLRKALILCEEWIRHAYEFPYKVTRGGRRFLHQRRADLLRELLQLQLKEFDK
jgi:hypothetical protein